VGARNTYTDWSPLLEVSVSGPLPLVEIATVISVGGIGVAIFNNYWSDRREQRITEVTRTAAVDERFMELYDASRETTFQENMAEVLYQYEWTDYDNYFEKYGPKTNVVAWAKIQSLAQYFEGIGVMLQSNSVEIEQVYRLLSTQIIRCWEKLRPVILEQRQRELDPRIYNSFETLYYAIKKYEQTPQKPSDDVKTHQFED
jgi:hypothetical protein